jgi:hypothetical protein
MSAEQRAREWRRAQRISDGQARSGLWIDKLLAAYASEREAQYNCDVCGKELPPDKWMQCAECAEKVEAELARARQEGREESFSALRWIRDQVDAILPEHRTVLEEMLRSDADRALKNGPDPAIQVSSEQAGHFTTTAGTDKIVSLENGPDQRYPADLQGVDQKRSSSIESPPLASVEQVMGKSVPAQKEPK